MPSYGPFDEARDLKPVAAVIPDWRNCVPGIVTIKAENRRWSDDEKDSLRKLPGLPTEMINMICEYLLLRPADLACLARTSTRLYAIDIPHLYRRLNINLKASSNSKLSRMTNHENPGLKHIKDVAIMPDFQGNQDSYSWIEYFLNAVPKDVLSTVIWLSPRNFPHRILHLLWQRQRKLKNLEVLSNYDGRHNKDESEEYDLSLELNRSPKPTVRDLRIVPTDGITLSIGCTALQVTNPTSLEVNGILLAINRPHETEEGTVYDGLTSLLFNHITPAGPGGVAPLDQLTSLKLADLDLRYVKERWCRYLEFHNLKVLSLEYCLHIGNLINAISLNASTPGLRELNVVHSPAGQGDAVVDSINDLLRQPRGTLDKLSLCIRNAPSLPTAEAILSHEPTLRWLFLDITGCGNLLIDDMKRILARCNKITHLGLHLPPATFEYTSFGQH
jgi:hypothetical protein